MKTLRNPVCALAACAGLLAAPAAWSQAPLPDWAYDVRATRGDTLSNLAWHRREGVIGEGLAFGISRADPEVFPGGNLGQQRGDERGAFRAHRQPGGWYQKAPQPGVP